MAIQRIRQLGDPILRLRSEVVWRVEDARGALTDMRDTLHDFQRSHGFGRGISAVQTGVLHRLIYLEFAGGSALPYQSGVYGAERRKVHLMGRLLLVSQSGGEAGTVDFGGRTVPE